MSTYTVYTSMYACIHTIVNALYYDSNVIILFECIVNNCTEQNLTEMRSAIRLPGEVPAVRYPIAGSQLWFQQRCVIKK